VWLPVIRNVTLRSNALLFDIARELERTRPDDMKVVILSTSGLKAIRIAEAIVILSEHRRWEEMRGLLRSLIEVVINACLFAHGRRR
jgi:hypothetical protein